MTEYNISTCANGCGAYIGDVCPVCEGSAQDSAQSGETVEISDTPDMSAMNTHKRVKFTVNGNPLPKQRPRTYRTKKGKVRTITPKKTLNYEALVAQSASMAHDGELVTGDVSVSIVIRRADNVRADIDNICKSVMDGMEGILYKNDSQVTTLYSRLYRNSENPGIDVTVTAKDTGE